MPTYVGRPRWLEQSAKNVKLQKGAIIQLPLKGNDITLVQPYSTASLGASGVLLQEIVLKTSRGDSKASVVCAPEVFI
jgi:hypothetical protein